MSLREQITSAQDTAEPVYSCALCKDQGMVLQEEAYKRPLLRWQERAHHAFGGNMGYVPGLLRHQWHGGKADRQYISRWQILIDEQFDPETDIVKDLQGLWALTGNKPGLRNRLMAYFENRYEDNTIAVPYFGR